MKYTLILFLVFVSTSQANDEIIGQTLGCKVSDYTLAENSEYVLPFPVGKEYSIHQGNCGAYTHKKVEGALEGRYAYDFTTPVGEDISALRSGVVIMIEESFPDGTNNAEHTNFIAIKHKDESIAAYIHITKNGVLVEFGDHVKQGDKIGIGGSSGFTGYASHLHFAVYEKEHDTCQLSLYDSTDRTKFSVRGCKSIPITFKNARPLDTPLRDGKRYKAVQY